MGLFACDDPFEDGRTLGARHVELVHKDQLTYGRMMADLETHGDKYADEDKRRTFTDGYREGIEPVKAEVTAMVVAHNSREAGAALADALEEVGEGFGRLVRGFADAVNDKDASHAEKAEKMKRMGRNVGAYVKDVVQRTEAFVEGLEEELNEAELEKEGVPAE